MTSFYNRAKNVVGIKTLPKSLYGNSIPLHIEGRFFDDVNVNTFVLDSIASDNGTLYFNNGTLVTSGNESNAYNEDMLLTTLSKSPHVISRGAIHEGVPTAERTWTEYGNEIMNKFRANKSPPTVDLLGMNDLPANSPTTSPPTTSSPATSSPATTSSNLLDIGDSNQSGDTSGGIELQELKHNKPGDNTNTEVIDSSINPMHMKGGTRRYRIRKRKTVNKRRMRKSKKSRR